jgi:hypothetical protein
LALIFAVDPIDRDIELALADVSPAQRSAAVAEFANEQITQIRQEYRNVLGREPKYSVEVDGRKGALLESVRPDGVIVAEFELLTEMLKWIEDRLVQHSPIGHDHDKHSGLYERSHKLFADGVEVDANASAIPDAVEYVFINTVPYARKIELGESSQAPDGVYQAVATLAQRRFGNIASISFAYVASLSGVVIDGRIGNRSENRNPAIVVKPRS